MQRRSLTDSTKASSKDATRQGKARSSDVRTFLCSGDCNFALQRRPNMYSKASKQAGKKADDIVTRQTMTAEQEATDLTHKDGSNKPISIPIPEKLRPTNWLTSIPRETTASLA